jgi:hypothetical protein
MSVSGISSNGASYIPSVKPEAEAAEVQIAGRDAKNDGDADDGGSTAVKAPTVNASGQKIGTVINVSA